MFALTSALISFFDCQRAARRTMGIAAISAALLVAGCAIAPVPATMAPSAEDVAKQQRLERAQNNLADGLKRYDAGAYDESMRSFLLALDSGVLTVPQQVTARKQMAFIHCVSNREAACKEEFEKVFALDPKFDLAASEAGHPTWGPLFRLVKTEIELRKSGRSMPLLQKSQTVGEKLLSFLQKSQTVGEKLLSDGVIFYDAADYTKAIKSLHDALKETLTEADQIRARKLIAFSYCLSNRVTLCRAEFEKIFQLKADFDLEPAEAGHPSWGPSFRAAKAKYKALKKEN